MSKEFGQELPKTKIKFDSPIKDVIRGYFKLAYAPVNGVEFSDTTVKISETKVTRYADRVSYQRTQRYYFQWRLTYVTTYATLSHLYNDD